MSLGYLVLNVLNTTDDSRTSFSSDDRGLTIYYNLALDISVLSRFFKLLSKHACTVLVGLLSCYLPCQD